MFSSVFLAGAILLRRENEKVRAVKIYSKKGS